MKYTTPYIVVIVFVTDELELVLNVTRLLNVSGRKKITQTYIISILKTSGMTVNGMKRSFSVISRSDEQFHTRQYTFMTSLSKSRKNKLRNQPKKGQSDEDEVNTIQNFSSTRSFSGVEVPVQVKVVKSYENYGNQGFDWSKFEISKSWPLIGQKTRIMWQCLISN